MKRSWRTRSQPESLPTVKVSDCSLCTLSPAPVRTRTCAGTALRSAIGWASVRVPSWVGSAEPCALADRYTARHWPRVRSEPSFSSAADSFLPATTVPLPERSSSRHLPPSKVSATCCRDTSGSGTTTSHDSPRPSTTREPSSANRSTSSPRLKKTSSAMGRTYHARHRLTKAHTAAGRLILHFHGGDDPLGQVNTPVGHDCGQAAVETAITLPLTVFLVLGTLQLFMMMNGRLMAEHAAFKAVRSGVVKHGDCVSMTHAAVAALLPSFSSFLGRSTPGATPAEKLATAVRLRTQGQPDDNRFVPGLDSGHDRSIVWIDRIKPRRAEVTALSEHDFDDYAPRANGEIGYRLEVQLVYWFPMKIPFANWVMASMFRAYFGLGSRIGPANPLMPVAKSRWTDEGSRLDAQIANEFDTRYGLQQYSFPIKASYAMRMMTPPRRAFFATQNCPHP